MPFAVLAAVIRCVWERGTSQVTSQEAVENHFIFVTLCVLDSEGRTTEELFCVYRAGVTPSFLGNYRVVCQLFSNIITGRVILLLAVEFE